MAFLLDPNREFTQVELAEETVTNRGTVSRHVRHLAAAGLIEAEGEGRGARWRVTDPDLLLDAWRADYDFWRHDVRQGHIGGRASVELLRVMAERFLQEDLPYAATGLAGAWLIEPLATFRLVTVYVPPWLPESALTDLGFRDEPRGANVWLVHARDEGVFMGSGITDGIRHVSAVQTYLDLKAQPERSEEAAEQLRRRHLRWDAR